MPIAMSKDEWARISKWTDENKEDPEAIRRREYIKYLDDQSREMAKSWPNSLENVNKRNEEIRRARHDKNEQANIRFYKRYLKHQIEKQERLMYSARDTIFKNKDAPKMLLSAVIESVTQKERAEQLKFKKQLQREDEEEKKAEEEEILRKAKEWNDLQRGKARKRVEVNQMHQREMFDHANEVRERRRKEAAEELAREIQDRERADKEIEMIREFEEEYKAKQKKRIWEQNAQSRQDTEQRRREMEARDKMDDQLLEVLARSQQNIECRRRKTEHELRAEKLRILDQISTRLKVGTAERDAHEQAILEKAEAEKLARDEARHQAWLDKKARNRAECIAAHEQYLRTEEKRQHEETTLKNWELINRFRNAELYEDYKERQREEKARKIKEHRSEILRLWKERSDREARELNEIKAFYGEATRAKFREADNKLLTHAAELLEEARVNGRPELPILKAIDRYCKLYRLYPLPPLPASLQAHFPAYNPTDGSQPDPGFKLPTPPPADRPTDSVEDDDDDDLTANGLQDLVQLKKGKPAKAPKEDKKGEPMKGFPANGMQPKQQEKHEPMASTSKAEDKLPCISVIPYCLCEK